MPGHAGTLETFNYYGIWGWRLRRTESDSASNIPSNLFYRCSLKVGDGKYSRYNTDKIKNSIISFSLWKIFSIALVSNLNNMSEQYFFPSISVNNIVFGDKHSCNIRADPYHDGWWIMITMKLIDKLLLAEV